MDLKCKNCGSRNTVTVPKSKLGKSNLGITGFVDPKIILEIIQWLAIVVLTWLNIKSKEKYYLVCKDCGYYVILE